MDFFFFKLVPHTTTTTAAPGGNTVVLRMQCVTDESLHNRRVWHVAMASWATKQIYVCIYIYLYIYLYISISRFEFRFRPALCKWVAPAGVGHLCMSTCCGCSG